MHYLNKVVDTYSDDTGIVLCYVDTSTQNPNCPYLLVKQTPNGPYVVGTTSKYIIENRQEPAYDDNMQRTEHVLLQKTVDEQGYRSLIYMLPIESDKNQLLGGFLFCRKRVDNECQTTFLGSVSATRFHDLKQQAIPLDLSPQYPFIPEQDVKQILPDTRIPLAFDHYRQTCHRLSKAILFMLRIKQGKHYQKQ